MIRFENQLKLQQTPEMVFASNKLRVEHSHGFGIEFSALDALKLVDASSDPYQVAASRAWQEARADCEHIKKVVNQFDWTYTTDYKGSLFGKGMHHMEVKPTSERVDTEKLKRREKILFYDDILLYEDELSDNGCSILRVKIRVMPTSFFILLRFYMRVDDVIVRLNDTRIYHEAEKNYILREFTSRDEKIENLKVPIHILTDPNAITEYLPVRQETYEKLEFPAVTTSNASGDQPS
ncbi:TIP41-like protein isoform X2 [Gigantopelta aegis]|uniref:TIP41-like protein isoform X2 n=1 Tax=Gigantopelta aegis TaxID=1735272 RepID=UPI001B88AAEB|nr:TIP41-like protein isoform X2 [Gigantopelta aegis]